MSNILASYMFLENEYSDKVMMVTESIDLDAIVFSVRETDKEVCIRLSMDQVRALSWILPSYSTLPRSRGSYMPLVIDLPEEKRVSVPEHTVPEVENV